MDLAHLWWFVPIALWSYALALGGVMARRRRFPVWPAWHVRGMGGSYIALVTALLVVNAGAASPLAWALPTLIGVRLIERAIPRGASRGGKSLVKSAPDGPASRG